MVYLGTASVTIDTRDIMKALQRRFPQARLESHDSEDEMISAIIRWRRNYTSFIETNFGSVGEDEDDILRFDTCINGYGECHQYELLCVVMDYRAQSNGLSLAIFQPVSVIS